MPAAGVPASVAVPSPLSVRPTPLGRVPAWVMATLPAPPEVVTVKVPALPTANVAWSVLVRTGGSVTVSVKLCVAGVLAALVAVIVIG